MGREAILISIRENKPTLLPLPDIDLNAFSEETNLAERFKDNVKLVGGRIKEIALADLDREIKEMFPNAKQIVCELENSSLGNISIFENTDPHDLALIDLAIIKGDLGVAENGSIWISENQFTLRALPFITNDLAIVLSKEAICLHMLNAYELIAQRERNFGLFISGPSKTADIEQCLVIGAQGAMSLTVYVV
ncbi:LutC/YkgG family protein [Confluentibacter sediminis]|uniref:LutC/YkgG family protein n=1 Tax=Confluentibacter sediminis TaxID=2219045 RepID=UPI0013A6E95D|nr:LUD domain-containing protein [Confluentibacter sediminis]